MKRNHRTIVGQRLLILSILVAFMSIIQGCMNIATTTEVLPYPKEEVLYAAVQVADSLHMQKRVGPLDALVYARSGFFFTWKGVRDADLYLKEQGTSTINDNTMIGAVKLADTVSGTRCTSVFATPEGDPIADSRLFLALTKQQILMDRNIRPPHVNPQKSVPLYIIFNTISPIQSTEYATKGNPLISNNMLPTLYAQNGFGDLVMVGCIVGAFLTKNRANRNGLLGVGISIGVLWRLWTLRNLVDLGDYNRLARTSYNLGNIRQ